MYLIYKDIFCTGMHPCPFPPSPVAFLPTHQYIKGWKVLLSAAEALIRISCGLHTLSC